MLSFTIRNLGDVAVFHCSGGITAGSDTGLREAVHAQDGVGTLVLDMAGVNAIDAAGLGTLVELLSWAKAHGKQFKLMNPTPHITRLLQLTKLNTAFEICSESEIPEFNRGLAMSASGGFGHFPCCPDAA
jgi:anti-sigma B factor antagonist